MGRAIVLMPGPYDSRGKKVNEVNKYDVFGSHNASMIAVGRVREMLGPTCLTSMNGCCTRYSGPSKLA
jgi:hypothetical protein